MSSTLTLVLASIIILFVIFIFVYTVGERAEVVPEEDLVIMKKPFKERKIQLDRELVSWKIQQAHYLRWGYVYSINMLLKNGKRIAIGSRFNQSNFELLYDHLSSRYKNREEPDK